MIKYKLLCRNCDLSFDSWFSSSKEYEKLKKKIFFLAIIVSQKMLKKI